LKALSELNAPVGRGLLAAIILLLVAALLGGVLAGCADDITKPKNPASPPTQSEGAPETPGEPPDKPVEPSPAGEVEFKEIASYEVDGELWTINFKDTVSPDGKWVLATQSDAKGVRMVALPLDGKAGEARALHYADREWTSNHMFGYYPLGWVSETQCLFVVQGWQNIGPHKGKRGVAVFRGDVGKDPAAVEEAGFIALSEGLLNSGGFFPAQNKAYLHVPKAIWEFDAANNGLKKIKGDLPTYEGLFYAKQSPDGRYFVYDIREKDAYGIYLFDTQTGRQEPLLPAGETMSFYPFWSPDGKYVAAYTVKLKKDVKAPGPGQPVVWQDYDILEGEDGPQTACDSITVVGLDGKIAQSIRVEGKKISTFRWGSGSNAIGFTAGRIGTGAGGVEQVIHDSMWLTSSGDALKDGASGEPFKVVDIAPAKEGENVYVMVDTVDSDGGGIIYTEYGDDKIFTKHVRLESSRAEPDAVEAGFEGWGMEYLSNDPMVGVLSNPQWSAVYAFQPRGWNEVARFEPNRQTLVLGYNDDVLAVANCPLWNPDMAKPGAKVEKSTIKAYKVVVGGAR